MQHSPPPLFKQGSSARVKVVFFAILAIFLLVVDARLKSLVVVRQVVGSVLYPVQMLAVMPRDAMLKVSAFFVETSALEKEYNALKQQQILQSPILQRSAQLALENSHLRNLLAARERLEVKSQLAEIIYDARDPFIRKIVLDRGSQHGVALGHPVIDDKGVVGQVTRLFPLTSEVTLLTDKNQAIPVQDARSGIHSVVNGRGQSAYLDMRTTSGADVQVGDMLVTSGIDGIYPPGLAVAKVVQVENKASTTFENVLCTPLAGVDRNRQLLILLVQPDHLSRPDTEEVKAKKEKINRKVTRDAALPPAVSNDAAASNTVPAIQTTSVHSTSPTSLNQASGLTAAPASAAKTAQSAQVTHTTAAPQLQTKAPKSNPESVLPASKGVAR